MSGKGFFLLVITVAIWGGAIGGAFAGGVAFGRGEQQEGPESALLASFAQGQVQRFTQGAGSQIPGPGSQSPGQSLRSPEPGSGGESSVREMPTDEAQAAPLSGTGDFQTVGISPLVNGVVSGVGLGSLTIETETGPVTMSVAESTSITRFEESDLEGLEEGENVLVMTGPAGSGGELQAALVIANLPEGAGFLGRGILGGRPQPR